MTIIGIDPSEKKGQAASYWINGKLVSTFKIQSMDVWNKICRDYNIDFVQIEDQYLGMNFNTAKHLTFEVGKMCGICDALGIKNELVSPMTWQSKLGITQITKIIKSHLKECEKITESKKKKIKQSIYIDIAKMIDGNISDDDVACAVLITYATNFITEEFKQKAVDIMNRNINKYFEEINEKRL